MPETRTREGMTPADINAMIAAAQDKLGGLYDPGLVLIGEASAYPHGSKLPHVVKRGDVVLMDCTCSVHGYQADITRTFVYGADPTRRAAQIVGPGPPGPADRDRRGQGRRARGSVDDAVRRIYESWGYGPRYKLPGTAAPHRPRHRHGGA